LPGSFLRRIIPARTSTGLLLTACSVLLGTAAARPVVASDDAAVTPRPPIESVPDSLRGTSRQLRARFISPTDGAGLQLVEERFGLAAARTPGVYAVPDSAGRPGFAYIVMRDFRAKTGARVGDYRVGYWPEERGRGRPSYEMPTGFIEVTEDNQDTFVSANFRLRDFLTKNQEDVWPKYLVLDERLLDKLELVTTELRRSGYVSHRLAVLSGFRTPDHNRTVRSAGASGDSRHQYGDAADVIVDGNGDGRMDDLNRDGRVNARDLALFLGAVERVETLHPDLVGGLGTYRSTRTTSGYLHIDVRGTRVRWGT
jgi:hypothetical protein